MEQIKKFELLDHDFSQEAGELTPTEKVKRNIVKSATRTYSSGCTPDRPLAWWRTSPPATARTVCRSGSGMPSSGRSITKSTTP